MPANAKKILITTESHEMFIIRRNTSGTVRGFCPACGEEVGMTSLDEAVSRSGVGGLELLERCGDGSVHLAESTIGHLLICSVSLDRILRRSSGPAEQNEAAAL